jgi:N-methylhydantoinase A/oxoprolinase/acetone carboxylase beta subunit
MSARLGIDTGGTFTDFVLLEEETGELRTAKVPSTPAEPARAIASGLAQLLNGELVDQLVVGTTIATNAALERRGPRLIYLTTEGFQDVPFIGRLDKEFLYDLHEVSALWREYERASTTLADAFVKPAIERYVDGIGETIAEHLELKSWNLLGSNGGYLSAQEARGRPAQLCSPASPEV